MQCVEFESRLNDLLDERLSPCVDKVLAEHAQNCPGCSDLLAAHELLSEGVQALATVRLSGAEQKALAHRVVVEVGNAPGDAFRPIAALELAQCEPTVVAKDRYAPLAIAGLVLAAAAALFLALLPARFRDDMEPAAPDDERQWIVGTEDRPVVDAPGPEVALTDYKDFPPIARVGYQVADGLTPVTNSMVSALRELRKRPFFRSPDEPQRSSFYLPREAGETLA